jgi:SAM-dependent methyltransferase
MLSEALRHFIRANVALSDRIMPLIVHKTHAYAKYRETGAALLERRPRYVLDVGAGRHWPFAPSLKGRDMVLIGFDIDMTEMDQNTLLDRKICGDACKTLGVPDNSIDLIMARAVVEHLHDTASFLKNANRALRNDGHLIVTFASRHAPFAILNRLLPQRVSQWLLLQLVPGSSGILGFKAYYDRASFREFRQSLSEASFEVESEYASYFSSGYFRFFVPLFIVSLAFDYVRYLIGSRHLASYFVFIARKRAVARDARSDQLLDATPPIDRTRVAARPDSELRSEISSHDKRGTALRDCIQEGTLHSILIDLYCFRDDSFR